MTVTLIDETKRPKAPPIPGATEEHRQRGRHLAAMHRIHMRELDRVRSLINQIETGNAAPTALGAAVHQLQMTQNYKAFGTLCGHECRALTWHHTSEDNDIFPILRANGTYGLRAVLDQLAAEHKIVHELLEDLWEKAQAIHANPGPETFAPLRKTFDTLDAVIRSHFGYEETQLEEALGFYNAL
ncbi:hypothetical protein BS627_02940 [Agrobacterium salinitolerans]|uniref:hemerythrin domain-containing protein n=1 Tax=Agrobacterium salinitolerans TaxID=1183413 RepID=UPI000990227B|nr:hemerythrin domain-containing protein [Agrobacterium salinitolerans]OOO27694.1 hypothetical protein BS627_02940 [Agrobacterium salinitolerans]PNQ25593.1 hemerythrin domain-containing protein [Rhizobium sp. YIC5082]